MEERLTIREAARQRKGLDGADAEALERALQQAEGELVSLKYCNEILQVGSDALRNSWKSGEQQIEILQGYARKAISRFSQIRFCYSEQTSFSRADTISILGIDDGNEALEEINLIQSLLSGDELALDG